MTKTLVGYCDPISARPGEQVSLMLSADHPSTCTVEVVRLICGDLSTKGHGFHEEVVARPSSSRTGPAVASWPEQVDVRHQPITPGSAVLVERSPWLAELRSCTLQLDVMATRPGAGAQSIVRFGSFELGLDELGGHLTLRVGGQRHGVTLVASEPLAARRWWRVVASFDADLGRLCLRQTPLPTRSPADRLLLRETVVELTEADLVGVSAGGDAGGPDEVAGLRFAGSFDGRIEAPLLLDVATDDPLTARRADGARYAEWDFAAGIGTTQVHDRGPLGLHGRTVQSPARAVTGARWDGTVQRWQEAPEHYAAIHFHRDDLTDAGWDVDVELTVPDLPSGLYAFRVTASDGEVDRTPFVVRPAAGQSTARLALLLPTATYYAYANHRMTIAGSEFFPSRSNLRPEFDYIRRHPEVGYSMYEHHDDQSGVMVSSRRRPILNLKPGADGWAFTADTNLVAYLTQLGEPFDIVTDDDLHREGRSLLDGYAAVMTGTHPEYWSTAMLDALEQWLGDGGRLLYLGGNGFYWRVAWSEDEPWVMEVRRAEDGTRGWIAEPGEYYHAHGGEYGGLWRRLGRPPNLLVGVGFAAQGFDRASPYRRTEASFDGPAAWIFDGVEGEVFGDHGVGGGAAGQEIDRYDPRLGSPAHAVVLATSFDHSDQMLRTKEEFLATALLPDDPNIRSDVVFFTCPNGGAVFSVGSISWFGALAHDGYRNDVATITTNVVRRFVDPAPL